MQQTVYVSLRRPRAHATDRDIERGDMHLIHSHKTMLCSDVCMQAIDGTSATASCRSLSQLLQVAVQQVLADNLIAGYVLVAGDTTVSYQNIDAGFTIGDSTVHMAGARNALPMPAIRLLISANVSWRA
jgi:hypothetical protein